MSSRKHSDMFRFAFVSLMACILAGCKLAVMVSSGGEVQSLSGTRNCSGPGFCEFDIATTDFSDTFTAVPNPGYEFVEWQDGSGYLCASSQSTSCTVSLPAEPYASALLALFDMVSIRPVFKNVGIDTDGDGIRNELDEDDDNDGIFDIDDPCPLDPSPGCTLGIPITDTVMINGREWAQVDLFGGLSWNDMNAVCPDGTCSGVLNEYNMTGWTWASLADVSVLFNYFIGSDVLNPAVSSNFYSEENSPWSSLIFLDGMRPTYEDQYHRQIAGWTSTIVSADPNFFAWETQTLDYYPVTSNDLVRSYGSGLTETSFGGFFYRNP